MKAISALDLSTKFNTKGILVKFLLCLSMAILTGISAQLSFKFPFTPIPITGQTAVVLLSGSLLGGFWGSLSQFIYIILGMIGVPWFASYSSGFSAVLSPSGGYLIGFVIAAYAVGQLSTRCKTLTSAFIVMLIGDLLIYVTGLSQFYLWSLFIGKPLSISSLLYMGFLPFIPGDSVKLLIASKITVFLKGFSK